MGLSMMGLHACCSDGKTACSDFSAAAGARICENADNFDGTVSIGGQMPCSALASNALSYFGTGSSCDAEVEMDGESVSKAAFLANMAVCCTDGKTACSSTVSTTMPKSTTVETTLSKSMASLQTTLEDSTTLTTSAEITAGGSTTLSKSTSAPSTTVTAESTPLSKHTSSSETTTGSSKSTSFLQTTLGMNQSQEVESSSALTKIVG